MQLNTRAYDLLNFIDQSAHIIFEIVIIDPDEPDIFAFDHLLACLVIVFSL
ncbi:MAG: hypothetical protein WC632_00720 [Candidatus Margulisiibacteriota bacterium]